MSISENRLKAIVDGAPFFPGEVVAMALELLANSKETLRPEYPETLPCPVILEPGFRFGKGVSTHLVLRALQNRAERYADLDAMGPEARAEHDAAIDELRKTLGFGAPNKLSITLPDIGSKAFWSATGKSEVFHPETYKRWAKEAIEHGCAIARIEVEVK
ncbi:hypothetical protein [Klebsiella pneumoniae]|uniref:hypothetical protein n=1 Tax=Klebsiella pneumoniae TaxID=573 RepID=UPI003B01D2EF